MATGRKSIIRRWETQVGIGIAVACFSVMGVFIGLKVGEDKKTDVPANVVQIKKVPHSQGAAGVESVAQAKEVSRVETVVKAEEQPVGIPDLDELNTKTFDPRSEFRYGQGESTEAGSELVQASVPPGTMGRALGNPPMPHPFSMGLPGEALEEPPAIESSSEDMVAVTGAAAGSAAEEKAAATYPKSHTVKPSDTLMGVAKEHYGDVSKWMLIFDANGLSNKDMLFVGQKLTIPSPEYKVKQQPVVKKASLRGSGSPGVAHRVQSGDTLRSLAKVYYNDESKWKIIYNANKGSLSGRETVKPGEILIIP